jgi:hypothetical protein
MQKATQETISKNFRQTFSTHHVRLFDTSLTIQTANNSAPAKSKKKGMKELVDSSSSHKKN